MTARFEAPGPGSWTQDATHFPRPVTAYTFSVFKQGFTAGFRESAARYGLLLSHLEYRRVNGFMYSQRVPIDGDDVELERRFAAAQTAFASRLWREDLRRWDSHYKPDSIRRNRALQSVAVDALGTAALSQHLEAVFENAREMFYRHHIFTVPSLIPLGHYLATVREWTGLDAGELLAPLRGSSPVSCGASEELQRVGQALTRAAIDPADFDPSTPAGEILDELRRRDDAVDAAIDAYLDALGLKLASGYDVADPCAIELPQVLLQTMWAARHQTTAALRRRADEAVTPIRDAVPARHREEFDELLAEARLINRLRDERGIYNDLWGTGVARWALLEAGRRLSDAGRLQQPGAAVDLSHEETLSMLGGGAGPSPEEVEERGRWRRGAGAREAPPGFGAAPPEPSLDGLPRHAALAMRAVAAVLSELATPTQEIATDVIVGRPVSAGVYEGTARVVFHVDEFQRLREGDVLVTESTSAAFNVVLPLLGAVVTDRGGQLSHAAIVAREYGIPAVVGARTATARIDDGARIRVDGTSGRVEVL